MISMTLSSQGPRITLADIAQFEREVSFVFPDAYKHFLVTQNGGFLTSRVGLRVGGQLVIVSNFLRLEASEDSGLRGTYRRIAERRLYPAGIRPIGRIVGDGSISIRDARDGGSVVLTNYSYEDDNPVSVNVTPLAGSFEEFLSKLEVIEKEEKCPVTILAANGTTHDLDAFLREGNSIDSQSADGNSLLCEAIFHDNDELISACIASGASLRGAVSAAIRSWSPHVLEQLIKAGADVEEKDESGCEPLDDLGGTEVPGYIGEVNRQLEKILRDTIAAKRRRGR